jgi:hypothetical protein
MSPSRPFRFDAIKGLEALLYISSRLEEDFYRVLKVPYFADKHHLENYGRLICGDHYIAMRSGVVPSGLYDFVKDVRDPRRPPSYGVNAREAFALEGHRIVPKREARLEFFSETDRESLDRAIEEVRTMDWNTLKARTHGTDYDAADLDDEVPFDALAMTLPNGELLLKALRG